MANVDDSPSSQESSSWSLSLPGDAGYTNIEAMREGSDQAISRIKHPLTLQKRALRSSTLRDNCRIGQMEGSGAVSEVHRQGDSAHDGDSSLVLESEDTETEKAIGLEKKIARAKRKGSLTRDPDFTSDRGSAVNDGAALETRNARKKIKKSPGHNKDLVSDAENVEGEESTESVSDEEELESAVTAGSLTTSQARQSTLAPAPVRNLGPVSERAIIAFPELSTRGHLSPSGNLEGLTYIDIFALISDPLDYKGSSQRYTHYGQYAPQKTTLPQGLHPRFIIEEYPNHIQGDVVSWISDLPWSEEYQSRDMLRILPEDARPIFRGQEQPHSYIQKRQTGSRLRILGRAYAANILDPDYRIPPTGKLFREYGRNGLEGPKYIEKGQQWLSKTGRRQRVTAIRSTPQNQINRWFIHPDLKRMPGRPHPSSRPATRSRSAKNRAQEPQPEVSTPHSNPSPLGSPGRAETQADPLPTINRTQSAVQSHANTRNISEEPTSFLLPPHRPRPSNRDRQTKPLGRQPPSESAAAHTATSANARLISAPKPQNLEFVLHRCRIRLAEAEDYETDENSTYLAKRRLDADEIDKVNTGRFQSLIKEEIIRLTEVTKLGIAKHRELSENSPVSENELNILGRHQVAMRIDTWVSRYHPQHGFWLGTVIVDGQDLVEHYVPIALTQQSVLMQNSVRAQIDIPDDAEVGQVKMIEISRLAAIRQLELLRQWTEEAARDIGSLLY